MDLLLLKIFLIIILIISIILYQKLYLKIEGFNNDCPDLLIQNGEQFLLYNTNAEKIKGINPKVFSKLSEYADFAYENPGCPVLFLQKNIDTQGNEVYNIRPGNPMNSGIYNGINIPPLANGYDNNKRISPNYSSDMSMSNNTMSKNYYPFDARGYDIGKFTKLDEIHNSEKNLSISDSANDTNWGGTKQVESGKYINNEVFKPLYSNYNARIN
jgi:hypothetical protein